MGLEIGMVSVRGDVSLVFIGGSLCGKEERWKWKFKERETGKRISGRFRVLESGIIGFLLIKIREM